VRVLRIGGLQMGKKFYFVLLSACAEACFAQAPFITSVVGGADYSDGEMVGIPLGSIFTIYGTGLAPSTAQAQAVPLPTTLNGVTAQISSAASGGSVLGVCPLWYVSPTQINAVLLSSLTPGLYYVSILAGSSQSQAWGFLATSGRFASFSQSGQGAGPAVVQQYDSSGGPFLNQLTNAAPPGSVLVLWGTGLGPLPSGSDASAPPVGTIRNDVTVYVDGVAATPFYAGRAPGLPGVDQINVALPSGITPRCFAPLQVVTGTAASGIYTVALSSGSSVCTSEFGLSPAALARLQAGGVVQGAILTLSSVTYSLEIYQTAGAEIDQYDTIHLAAFALEAYGAPANGTGTCGFYGPSPAQPLSSAPPAASPVIAGPSGCTWVSGFQVSPGCPASSFAFSGPGYNATGTFQPPMTPTTIANLSAQWTAQGLAVTWSANLNAAGVATLTFGSSQALLPQPFGPGLESTTVICTTNATDTPFVLPAAYAADAFRYAIPMPAELTLTATIDQVFPASGPLDFVLVRTVDSVSAAATIN